MRLVASDGEAALSLRGWADGVERTLRGLRASRQGEYVRSDGGAEETMLLGGTPHPTTHGGQVISQLAGRNTPRRFWGRHLLYASRRFLQVFIDVEDGHQPLQGCI